GHRSRCGAHRARTASGRGRRRRRAHRLGVRRADPAASRRRRPRPDAGRARCAPHLDRWPVEGRRRHEGLVGPGLEWVARREAGGTGARSADAAARRVSAARANAMTTSPPKPDPRDDELRALIAKGEIDRATEQTIRTYGAELVGWLCSIMPTEADGYDAFS